MKKVLLIAFTMIVLIFGAGIYNFRQNLKKFEVKSNEVSSRLGGVEGYYRNLADIEMNYSKGIVGAKLSDVEYYGSYGTDLYFNIVGWKSNPSINVFRCTIDVTANDSLIGSRRHYIEFTPSSDYSTYTGKVSLPGEINIHEIKVIVRAIE